MNDYDITKAKIELQEIIDAGTGFMRPEDRRNRAEGILLDLIGNKEISQMFENIVG